MRWNVWVAVARSAALRFSTVGGSLPLNVGRVGFAASLDSGNEHCASVVAGQFMANDCAPHTRSKNERYAPVEIR